MKLWFVFIISFIFSLSCNQWSRKEEGNGSSKSIEYGNNADLGRYKQINGIKMYYETYGSGNEVVLMLHGNFGSIGDFKNQIPYFSKQYKVIAVDSRSHGNTIDSSTSITYDSIAEDMATLLDSLNIDSLNIIGFSDGGIVALLLAIKHPEKVKKMAISGANLKPDSTVFSPGVYSWMNESIKELEKSENNKLRGMTKVVKMMQSEPHIAIEKVQKIECPVLVISGDHDAIQLSHTLEIYENIKRSYLWVEPASGHAIIEHKADLFNDKVEHFFKNGFEEINWMN